MFFNTLKNPVKLVAGMTLIAMCLLVCTTFCSAQTAEGNPNTVYVIKADIYENDSAVLRNISASTGNPSFFSGRGDYIIEELAPDGTPLVSKRMEVSFIIKLENLKPAGKVPKLKKFPLILRLPADPNTTVIKIAHGNRTILYIDLSKELCDRDDNCEPGENDYNCPSDCGIKSAPYPASGQIDAKGDIGYIPYLVALLLIVLLSLSIFVFLNKRRNKRKKIDNSI